MRLLSGEHDRLVPPADVRAPATRIPHARFVPVAGAGHWLPRDPPGQVTSQLIAFLATAAAAPGSTSRRLLTVPETEPADSAAGANKAGNE